MSGGNSAWSPTLGQKVARPSGAIPRSYPGVDPAADWKSAGYPAPLPPTGFSLRDLPHDGHGIVVSPWRLAKSGISRQPAAAYIRPPFQRAIE